MSPASHPANHTLAICGGVGGAKLALGLYHLLKPRGLGVVVNTGDDFEHLGLHISPDIDSLLYTLAGCNNPETGWGRADETWTFMSVLESLGGATWFQLGDGDLALHVERTRRLRAGENLTQVCAALAGQMGLHARILPMSDDPARTILHTPDGPLPFQHYFVKEACRPRVTGITIEGAESARPNPALLESLADPTLRAVVICPSNPYLSIDPILAIPACARRSRPVSRRSSRSRPLSAGERSRGRPPRSWPSSAFRRTTGPSRHTMRG